MSELRRCTGTHCAYEEDVEGWNDGSGGSGGGGGGDTSVWSGTGRSWADGMRSALRRAFADYHRSSSSYAAVPTEGGAMASTAAAGATAPPVATMAPAGGSGGGGGGGGRGAPSTTAAAVPLPPLSAARLRRYYALAEAGLPPALRLAYRPLAADEETQTFLDSCRPNWCVSMAATVLRWFMSVTDTNGVLGRGQMFVVSRAHVRELLAPVFDAPPPPPPPVGASAVRSGAEVTGGGGTSGGRRLRLLDVGAGDGGVTAHLAPYFDDVWATEVSRPMAGRLREKGYSVVVTPVLTPEVFPTPASFDVVSIFNVLDRCDHPADLLRGAARLLRPDTGRLLLAVVLPFSEFVEDGTRRRKPYGALPMRGARCGDGASFEASLSALVTRVLLPLGLEVERAAKVPYLCRGDHHKPYYVLADAILVCRLRPGVGAGAAAGDVGTATGAAAGAGAAAAAAATLPPLSAADTLAAAAAAEATDRDTFRAAMASYGGPHAPRAPSPDSASCGVAISSSSDTSGAALSRRR